MKQIDLKNIILDKEELEIEKAIEAGEYKPVSRVEFEKTKKMLQEAVKNTIELNKSKPITLRLNQLDLIKIKAKAARKNIPYQTLIGSVLREYANH